MNVLEGFKTGRRKLLRNRAKKKFLTFLETLSELARDPDIQDACSKLIDAGEKMAHNVDNCTPHEDKQIENYNQEIFRKEMELKD